jgi:hypothetical protein
MTWESIGSTNTGQMPNDEAWILFSIGLAKQYVLFVCGDPPEGGKLDVMWHDHELGSYPSLGVWSEFDPPWDYINACERALEIIDESTEWYQLKQHWESSFEDQEDDGEEDGDDDQVEGDSNISPEVAEALTEFSAKAHACAMQMLENAAYIEQELPKIEITEEGRRQILEVCSALVGTKHDVITELSDLADLDLWPGADEIQNRVKRIMGWSAEELPKLHGLVQTLQVGSSQDRGSGLAFLLVAESATNVLKAFSEMSDAAEKYLGLCSSEDGT